ncbi:ribulose-bisphosphate carboxylase large subunit [Candidatus Pacearchaeota archaeon]|uniref:RuBisCO long chain, Form III-like n=1 Tax=uncultured Candidatus Pacearchaeota archaeon TaxID=2109283 RepID=A0A447IUF2_9ARCH|nr:ribulose-bisphosphate carboxylase large subunit [Candidatus Pacearchaeota archaeon]VDS11133.1 RuBisCO long chain, Form III-like [uncultured Candidatus Pacearchaeota archaeon]VDS11155.1 RuBisCO long chain, Form III-like [uncultured Candidatus Pacearchaeota archaeon]
MIKIAVQFNYVAKKGWKPQNEDNYVITLLKAELSDSAIAEAKKSGKNTKQLFEEAAGTVAAESSTGTWTKVYDGKDSGIPLALRKKALAYDLDNENFMFKIAYPLELFELDNISGLLAGIVGNIAGMKMLSGLRIYDIKFPKAMIAKFPGPAFGVKGVRKMLRKPKGPLTATVPKPKIGRTDVEQAKLARILFTSGNGTYDGIKDDENLTNLSFNHFDKRISLVLKEAREAEKLTGNKKFYLANITHSNLEIMKKHAELIKKNKGVYCMIDVVTTGFTAIDTFRRMNTGLAIHAHRAMHGFMTRDNSPGVHGKGKLYGFSISMIVLAKVFRLLGVDNMHGGSPLAKMEDYGEAKYIKDILQEKITKSHLQIPSLGQNWHHIKPVWMVASGGLHPGDIEKVLDELGEDVILQFGGGLLGHPQGIEAGVKAIEQARDAYMKKIPLRKFIQNNPNSELAAAVRLWGYGPKIIY